MKFISKLDTELLEIDELNKLMDYSMIEFNKLKVGDHFRYTSNKYKDPRSGVDTVEDGRKLTYAVVKTVDEDFFTVNGYQGKKTGGVTVGNKYPDWKIEPKNKYKNYIFYKKHASSVPTLKSIISV